MPSQLPVPRSRQQVIGAIIDSFRSRTGIQTMRVGSGLLNTMEAAGASDVRSAQDVFNALNLRDLERVSGSLLDFVARDEQLIREQASAATGYVNFTDPRYTRISSRVYSGAPAINVGSLVVRVSDALSFPASGSIYIGRGTINVEGPLTYSGKAQVGNYWTLTLVAPTSRYHNINEDVVLAQGGNRPIQTGSTVSTNSDGRGAPIEFATARDVVILDGEVGISNVPVTARQSGTTGNVPAYSIRNVVVSPFPQAQVSNPLPLSNAIDTESDPALRNRIRQARASRARGTPTAILFNAQGVYSQAENRRVLSANLVQPANSAATLYIDDGNGYEELTAGVAYEALMDSASGGETFFTLSGPRPVAKAFLRTQLSSPFSLVAGSKLAVQVGDTYYEHTFNAEEFVSIGSALAEEVVSSINADPNIGFSARTSAGATRVSIFARAESPDNLQLVEPISGVDANTYLGFSTDAAYTIRLYKDDKLLYKDGLEAVIYSQSQSFWLPMTSPVTIKVQVDSTPAIDYTITDAIFQANTVYSTVSSTNSLESWAAVINAVVPGITAAAETGRLSFKSNLGANSRAKIAITDGSGNSVVDGGMFLGTELSIGQTSDFSLARNTGQITLAKPLTAGQSLTVGSRATRASIQSALFAAGTMTVTADTRMWVAADANAASVQVPFTPADLLNIASYSTNNVVYTCTSNANAFNTVQVGDWAILWDPAFSVQGAYKVVFRGNDFFVVNRPGIGFQTGVAPTLGGLRFFRLNNQPQEVRIPANSNYTLQQVADIANTQLTGANMDVYRNKYLRIRTANMTQEGSIAILAVDTNSAPLQFTAPSFALSSISHLASQKTGSSEVQVPDMGLYCLGTNSNGDKYAPVSGSQTLDVGDLYIGANFGEGYMEQAFRRHFPIIGGSTNSLSRFRATFPFTISSAARVGTTVTVQTSAAHGYVVGDVVTMCGDTLDANFPFGEKIVTVITNTTTFQYQEAGAATTLAQPYYVRRFFGLFANASAEFSSTMVSAKPYQISPQDNLVVVMDNNTNNLLFNVQMYRRLLPTSSTYGNAPISVVDADNANAPLSTAFGAQTTDYFQDFYAYMRARTVSHANDVTKSILWRSTDYGPNTNGFSVVYENPQDENLGIAHQLVYGPVVNTTGPVLAPFGVVFNMPSGARRAGTGLLASMRWTSVVSSTTGGYQVVFSYSAPTIAIGGLTRSGSTVTANTGANAHGYSNGDTVYITSSDPNYPSGPKIVFGVAAFTFQYTESGTGAASVSGSSVSSAPSAPTLSVSITAGDIVLIRNAISQQLNPVGAYRVTAVSSTSFTILVPTGGIVPTSITTPKLSGNIDNLIFYPIDNAASTSTAYVAYALANLPTVLTGTLLPGSGAGQIINATRTEFMLSETNNVSPSSVVSYVLSDGLNYVESNVLTVLPNTITLKNAATNPNLATADVGNEEIRLVPVTAEGLVKYLGSQAVSGISTVGEVETVSPDDFKMQIVTDTLGDQGGVEIRGSIGNSASVALVSTEGSDRINVESGAANGMVGGFYVRLANTLPTPKQVGLTAINAGTTIQLSTNGTIAFSTAIWSRTDNSTFDVVRVVQVGDYSVYLLDGLSGTMAGIEVGGYMQVVATDGLAVNKQLRRIQAFSTAANVRFVVTENVGGADDNISTAQVNLYTASSIVPGDTIYIGYSVGVDTNQGAFLVTGFGASGLSVVTGNTFTAAGPVALGTNFGAIRATEDNLAITAKISGISPNVNSPNTLQTIYCTSGASSTFWQKFSKILGATVSAVGKLAIPSTRTEGPNGYNSNVGLIGEVVKVLYGVPTASTTFPGVVAAGAVVNTAGPNTKRIQVSLQVRLRSGTTQSTTIARIKTAIASVVNRTKHGTAVALGAIVAAAQTVEGVAAVVMLSPSFTSANDVISVQANEKPKILDIETDIRITVVS